MSEDFVIERLGAQGDGVVAESAVFVPLTLPGETVRARRLGDRATLERVLEPSPERVEPECPHYGSCGGCMLQHASDEFVAGWKRELAAAALAARGITGIEIRPVLTSPPGARRRITVAAKRTRSGVQIGFHGRGSDMVVGIDACLVAAPPLIDALPGLAEIAEIAASRKGQPRITLTLGDGGVDCAVTEAKPLDGPGLALLAGMAARAGLARLTWNGEVAVSRVPVLQRFGRARVAVPPGAFLQPTAEGEAALVAAVAEAVGDAGRVADLFAGSGTFALPLAERAEVLAVEGEAAAMAALDAGWRGADGLKRVQCLTRDLFKRPLRRDELKGLDAVVIDPPRAGARAQFEQLAETPPARVASVSCNPATFARDARILLDAGYRLDWVQPVDQFRWSPHLELVGAFSR
ncbi:class I SAM-dependent RNA methyltransferase [Paralimibaculum aggregatum]|uniref:Class I SAM-dependent RNA methyltransferase n=1 Tax=Paralimibaculum aggregatum TaxID=3036245 RepID=A0ABQ6LM00_9RHOB|nr:RsmD family RNA methyltransferase [Limibaculum sp. NKW23]GMG84225.1 class I SAM-dependent RNA methyltransferase [Limibaculum sp. NKW23]